MEVLGWMDSLFGGLLLILGGLLLALLLGWCFPPIQEAQPLRSRSGCSAFCW